MGTWLPENFTSLAEVQQALRREGLESSSLIVAIDFTASNDAAGQRSFHGLSLHDTSGKGGRVNPYEAAIEIVAATLSEFDDDNQIPAYGFGDVMTESWHVFSFFENDRPADGFEELLQRYKQLVPTVCKAGPTCFAPVIQQALKIVQDSDYEFHVLLIIADGQVTRDSETLDGEPSLWEQLTAEAICQASEYPLSIIMVGVGDGPFDTMDTFDSHLTDRRFDNFRFVNFTQLQAQTKHLPRAQQEACFALEALRELPAQYRYIKQHNLMGADREDPSDLPDFPEPKPPPEGLMGL